MDAARKSDLDRRLEAYFTTLRPSSRRKTLILSAGTWQRYAAVTGSAMAMVTNASASIIGSGTRDVTGQPFASVQAARQNLSSSKTTPLLHAVKLAMAKRDLEERSPSIEIGRATQALAPSISPGGVVPLYGNVGIIQAGEWISIYGTNLASETTISNGDFPTSLAGTSVEIDGKSAYLLYVSPTQINLQAPDDTSLGTVSVVVTTAGGTTSSAVTLSSVAPTFSLLDAGKHVSAIILRTDHSGAFGGGTYDILGPTGNSLGYPTAAARAGDTVEIFANGFGPTNPAVPSGRPFSGAAPISNALSLYINFSPVTPSFVGLSSAGVYQINITVPPGLGQGEVPIQAVTGGMGTQLGVLFSLEPGTTVSTNPAPPPVSGGGGSGGGGTFGFGGGSGGGFGGGSGGGSGGSVRRANAKKLYEPRLRFTP